jgi:OOP family OmpA-OmpF porin
MKHSKLLAATLFVVMPLWQAAVAGNGASAPPVHKRYVGFDIGNSRASGGLAGGDTTEGSTGFALRFGYQFNRYLAAEIGYADFGDFTFEYRPGANNCPGRPPGGCDIDTSTTLRGPLINVVGLLPLSERWALKGRAGVFHASVSSLDSGPGAPTSPPPSRISDSNNGLHFGAAATYRFNDHMEVELGWTYFEQLDLGLTVGGSGTVFSPGSSSLASIGLAWRF